MSENSYLVAVFPFLKTSEPIEIGSYTFRSTLDTDGLPEEQANSVKEIAAMLFLQDEVKIEEASYAIIPFDGNDSSTEIEYLKRIQNIITYLYDNDSFDDPQEKLLWHTEYASIVLFSPGRFYMGSIQPDYDVETIRKNTSLGADEFNCVLGYRGLYNFRHPFYVASGSRLYGPVPHPISYTLLDPSKKLKNTIDTHDSQQQLPRLLEISETNLSSRIFTALQWYACALQEGTSEEEALIDMSIAFEALLGLPKDAKTERLVDAITLLLGRLPRIDTWAGQFYDARSAIVHEGRAQSLRFFTGNNGSGQVYRSLISYGREIFRLCLSTLLTGAELAEKAGLKDKLVTNQERFEEICTILRDEQTELKEYVTSLEPIIEAIERFRFVPENNLRLDTMIGACRRTAKCLLKYDNVLTSKMKKALNSLIKASKDIDHYSELDAIYNIFYLSKSEARITKYKELNIGMRIIISAYDYVSLEYLRLKKKNEHDSPIES